MLSRITLRQMEYFVTTAESGSIIIASEKIHISSPSISAAIAHMESELHAQLFIRQHAKGLLLTEIGEQVKNACKVILAQSSDLYSMSADFTGVMRGKIKVGCFSSFAPFIYAEIIHGFSHLYSQVDLEAVIDDHHNLLQELNQNTIDLALLYDLHIDENLINFTPLADLPPYVLLAKSHPLAKNTAVTLEELTEYPMILLDMPYSNDYFLSLFRTKRLKPNIKETCKYVDVIRSMVGNNIGYTILNVRPKTDFSYDGKELVMVRISGDVRPMKIGIATPKNASLTNVQQAFASRCQAFISNQYIPGMSVSYFSEA
ncbi:LysR family transcriptional regulator, partial [Psychrobacter sp. AOP7-B1-24]